MNTAAEEVLRIAKNVDLNVLQLHGDESPADVRLLSESYPVIKAFRVGRAFRAGRLARYRRRSAFLLDGFDRKRRGGTGKTFDWRLARKAQEARSDYSGGRIERRRMWRRRFARRGRLQWMFAAEWNRGRGKKIRGGCGR